VGCTGYPDCRYIKKEPPKSTGVTCPQCGQGELVEKRTRFGLMYGCERYPDCDCAVNNPPEKDIPCPDCGGLLLRRPKSLRCWHCGAEVDLDMKVTKPGDREAEAAARAAKAEARKARAAARAPRKTTKKTASSRKAPAGKTAAKRKKSTKKKAPATKKTAAKPTIAVAQETAPEPVTAGEES
jgi:DNA topoisomerase-1